jgi:predicted metal-dependent hydrolase
MNIPKHWPKLELRKQQRQKNMRVSVNMNRILVSGPIFVSNQELIEFAVHHAEWIEKTLKKVEKSTKVHQVKEANEPFLYLSGNWVPFQVETSSMNFASWDHEKHKIIAKIPIDFEKTPLKVIKTALYQHFARTIIPREFQEFAKRYELHYSRLFIRSQKTKWGTCSSNDNISFNYRLIKCPVEIRYYLYAHESSHLVHMNHSKEFWKLVSYYDPDYKEHEKWLRANENFLFNVD